MTEQKQINIEEQQKTNFERAEIDLLKKGLKRNKKGRKNLPFLLFRYIILFKLL